MELTIRLASLCLALLTVELNKGKAIEKVIPKREMTRINSRNVNPFSFKKFL